MDGSNSSMAMQKELATAKNLKTAAKEPTTAKAIQNSDRQISLELCNGLKKVDPIAGPCCVQDTLAKEDSLKSSIQPDKRSKKAVNHGGPPPVRPSSGHRPLYRKSLDSSVQKKSSALLRKSLSECKPKVVTLGDAGIGPSASGADIGPCLGPGGDAPTELGAGGDSLQKSPSMSISYNRGEIFGGERKRFFL